MPARTGKPDPDFLRERETAVAAVLLLPLGVHAAGDHVGTSRIVFMKARLIEHHQAIRIMERQGLEQNATHHREQRDVGANAQRHHQDGDDGKTGGAAKRAQTKAQIACEGFKPVPGPDGASLFTNKSRIAKGAQGCVAGLFC